MTQQSVSKTSKMTHLEYRRVSKWPTKPGWYYGRIAHEPIHPVLVKNSPDGLVGVHANGSTNSLGHWDWFGPVIEVREG